ncbi:hypothetical protein NE237_020443 [Protea cynaroides]|uniref:Gag protein n=1 Tax=Protea cynaroides TaxID=273540 RepID=A0A9Q0H940_9MAGN|nr:hypothetical protein NE237_020443 [Protea cynaroides]
MLLSWINATLSESALPYIVGVSSAKKAWDLLKQWYASTTPAHIMSLKRQLNHIKKGSWTQTTSLPIEELRTLLIYEEIATADDQSTDNPIAMVAFRPNKPPSSHGAISSRGRGYHSHRGGQNSRRAHQSSEGGSNPPSNISHLTSHNPWP